jgi:peptide/nickel transport system permease protein
LNGKAALLKKIISRTLWFILTMWILSVGVFYLARLAPGDPLQSFYGDAVESMTLDEVRKDYVLLAKSKGCTKTEIVLKHCFRNVAPTIVSIMAISIPHVLSGTYIAEAVFNYPGVGALSVESTKYHDYNLLMLVVLITGVMVILSSIIAQSINEVIDPRMKLTEVSAWRQKTVNNS